MPKTLRVGFYQPHVLGKAISDFDGIVDAARQLPDDETRTLDRPDGSVRLQFIRQSMSVWIGELIRIRIGEEPKKANLRGKVELIHLEEDEGLGEETAFLYDPELNVIVYHEHRGGVTTSNAARYFRTIAKARSVQLKAMIKPEALERCTKCPTIHEFVVHLAGVNSGIPRRGMGHSAWSLIRTAEEFQAPRAQFRMAVGKAGRLVGVKQAVTDLLSNLAGDGRVTKLEISGSESDGTDVTVIDLLEDRMVDEIQVELKDGRVTDSVRHAAVFEAWQRHRDDLKSSYGQKTKRRSAL